MATSGTVATVTVNLAQLAEHAHRRCGVLPGAVTGEMLDAFSRNLFMLTSAWSNRGILLWSMDRQILGVYANQSIYALPNGTVDILDANYRSGTRLSGGTPTSSAGGSVANAFDADITTYCTQTSADGNILYNAGQATVVNNVGFLPGPGCTATHIVWEYSTDGVTWLTALDPGVVTQVDSTWVWNDLLTANYQAQYWRVRETGGGILVAREVVLQNTPNEIPMARFNMDDYDALPNKMFRSTRILQYYVDRLIDFPQMNVWPLSTSVFDQIVVRRHRQIMDPGALTNQMEVPQRWLLALSRGAAAITCEELLGNPAAPNATPQLLGTLDSLYQRSLNESESEERDNSGLYIAPVIRGYTA